MSERKAGRLIKAMADQAREWIQLNVALARREGSALPAARFVLRGAEEVLPPHRQSGTILIFQRKPPDLRLRFFGAKEPLRHRISPLITRGKSDGHILRSFYSVYEPEYRQFGGRECMRSIHAYWSTDSLAWIAMDRLSERSAFAIPHATLIAAVLDDLFWRVLADAGEVWDTWCNLQTILQDRTAPENVPAILPSLEDICSAASVAEADLVARYQRANAALAKGLVRAWETGRMQCGARSILPFVALFTLNRHGFDQAKAAMIVSAMIVARNPKQQLRGAQLDLARSCAGSREHHRPRRSAGRMKADD